MNRFLHYSPLTLAIGYVGFGIAALILFAVPLWYAWQITIEDGRTEVLREDAQRMTEVFNRSGANGLAAFINERIGLQIANERLLLLTDKSFRPLAGNLASWPSVPEAKDTATITLDIAGHPTQAVIIHAALADGFHLLVGRGITRYAPLQKHFWFGLAGSVGILAIVGILGGFAIQRALLARIHSTQQTVAAIMQGDLSHRLITRPNGDELDTFSATINRMLDQIEQLVSGIKNVSNSIAHDLRTPLAELRSRLEELSLTRPPAAETFEEIEAAVADVDRVIGIFNALLRLAEIDSGMRRSGFVQVNATQLALEATEFYLPAAELRGIQLSCRTEKVCLSGDRLLLTQALSNLIENALKYAPENGIVNVAVTKLTDGTTAIVVADNGPGIPDEEKPKVAQRFYRGDSSRGTPGVGLGLSLVEAVAHLHGGVLDFSDTHPGLRARMTIEPPVITLASMNHSRDDKQSASINLSVVSPN